MSGFIWNRVFTSQRLASSIAPAYITDPPTYRSTRRTRAPRPNPGGITKAKMGSVRTAAPSKDGVAAKGKTKGKQIAMKGGKPLGMCGGGMAKGKK